MNDTGSDLMPANDSTEIFERFASPEGIEYPEVLIVRTIKHLFFYEMEDVLVTAFLVRVVASPTTVIAVNRMKRTPHNCIR